MGDNTAPMKTIDLGPLNDVIKYADNLRIAAEAKKGERDSMVEAAKKSIWDGSGSTGDWLKDVALHEFGEGYKVGYDVLCKVRELLEGSAGQYMMIFRRLEDLFNVPDDRDMDGYQVRGIPYTTATFGRIAREPLMPIKGKAMFHGEDDPVWMLPGIRNSYWLGINFADGEYVVVTPPRSWRFHDPAAQKTKVELKVGDKDYVEPEIFSRCEKIPPYAKVHPSMFLEAEFKDSSPDVECFYVTKNPLGEERKTVVFALHAGNERFLESFNAKPYSLGLKEPPTVSELYCHLARRVEIPEAEKKA